MAAFVALLSLASSVFAIHAPLLPTRDYTPLVRAVHYLAPAADAHLSRRQSSSAAADTLDGLLRKAVAGQSGGKCSTECADWIDLLYSCLDEGDYTRIGMCACGSDETSAMQTCVHCYGSSDEKGANAFADYCASALDDVSSLASGTASSRSTDSTASTYSRGISGFSPASTASSAVAAGSSRSVSDGTDSDTVSRSESTARGAATGSSRIDGGSSAAGGLKAGSALVAAAVGGVFAVLVL